MKYRDDHRIMVSASVIACSCEAFGKYSCLTIRAVGFCITFWLGGVADKQCQTGLVS